MYLVFANKASFMGYFSFLSKPSVSFSCLCLIQNKKKIITYNITIDIDSMIMGNLKIVAK